MKHYLSFSGWLPTPRRTPPTRNDYSTMIDNHPNLTFGCNKTYINAITVHVAVIVLRTRPFCSDVIVFVQRPPASTPLSQRKRRSLSEAEGSVGWWAILFIGRVTGDRQSPRSV
jgi:hypothetical protein